jgi:TusA-related sulfurtransferase
MATVQLDCNGLRCPQPILKIATKVPEMKSGDTLEVLADCPSFTNDIKTWCDRTKKTLLFCNSLGGGKFKAQIKF